MLLHPMLKLTDQTGNNRRIALLIPATHQQSIASEYFYTFLRQDSHRF
jgi:hypothetical protein